MVRNIRKRWQVWSRYDHWFSEKSLYDPEGAYGIAMGILREKGLLADKEGALWFSSSELGEDKDNVVVRSDGHPTYYASDIAYHWDKFIRRGFDLVIDVWGADHHGHVSRLKTATRAVGANADGLHILLYQLVTLKREDGGCPPLQSGGSSRSMNSSRGRRRRCAVLSCCARPASRWISTSTSR
jgi:arginyl-tRNA synthetase